MTFMEQTNGPLRIESWAAQSESQRCEAEITRRLAEGPDRYSIPVPPEDGEEGNLPLQSRTATELMQLRLPQPRFLVEGLLGPGLALLAAPPKYGKSWMVMDLCICVARGEPFLGMETCQADCLYMALEDGLPRLQDRVRKLLGDREPPRGVNLIVGSPELATLGTGLYDQLDDYLHPSIKLVVIDTLQRIRGGALKHEGAYEYDYREMGDLKGLADHFGVTILLVHHLNKMTDNSDPHNRISGTAGILGAADTSLVLTRSRRSDELTLLSVTGRDIESREMNLEFNAETFRWERADGAAREQLDYDRSPVVETIRHLLDQNDGQWKGTVTELMERGRELTGMSLSFSARQLGTELRGRLMKQLLERDGIQLLYRTRGSGSSIYHIRRIGSPALPMS